jgi:hypothetical protein
MKPFIIIILVALTCISCDQEIELTLPSAPQRLIVEGRIELIKGVLGSTQIIELSTMGDYFKNEQTPRVRNATVSVKNSRGDTYEFIHNDEKPGQYENNTLQAEVGEIYTLSIIWLGEQYEAQETLVSVSSIDSIYQIYEEENQFEDAGLKVAVDFTDPENENNYYFWELFVNDNNSVIPDPGNSQNLIASDRLFNGQTIRGYLPSEEKIVVAGDIAKVMHIGISKAYFDYLFLLFEQTGQTGQLFDVPPAGIKGNIRNVTNPRNAALGYFGAVEIDEVTLIIQPN